MSPAREEPSTGATGSAKERLDRFWDASRSYYEQAAASNPEASPERQLLFSHLASGDRVLDLGSGSCENALWLPEDTRYWGTDVSTAALLMAGEKSRPGGRVRSDGESLPFADGAFDAVLSTWALEHFHEPGRTLLEAARVVRPGGLMLIVGSAWDLPYDLPPSLSPARRVAIALRRLLRQVRSLVGGPHVFEVVAEPLVLSEGYVPDADAVHVAQSWRLQRFLEAAGLEIVEMRCLAHRPDPSGPRGWLRAALRRVPWWRRGWGATLFIARRGDHLIRPPYRLLPL
ncbi:MAG: class I SAM-dependent methyltransferase [Acidobacteriota bacterium]